VPPQPFQQTHTALSPALRRAKILLLAAGLVLGTWGYLAQAAFVYKNYTVHDDRGEDVLCDPYVVQPNDWVFKVFRQKGEIAQRDFGEFLALFKRLNPQVQDINLIRPGQRIMIPLRKLARGSLRGQASGTVTIPFVTVADDTGPGAQDAVAHVVRPGDSVSALIHRRFGTYGSANYRRGLERFKALNPNVLDINRIFIGKRVMIPERYVDEDLLNRSGAGTSEPSVPEETADQDQLTPLETAARVLNARLRHQGTLSFPYGGANHRLELNRFPILEMAGGQRFLVTGQEDDGEPAVAAARAKWPELHVIRLTRPHDAEALIAAAATAITGGAPVEPVVFTDEAVQVAVTAKWIIADGHPKAGPAAKRCITPLDTADQRTPKTVANYLARHGIVIAEFLRDTPQGGGSGPRPAAADKAVTIAAAQMREFVAQFVEALGYRFSANVTVSFPYAGIQVTAASNLISTAEGGAIFVDFGDLYGEGIQALQNAGFDMIRIDRRESHAEVIPRIAAALGLSCQRAPVLWACRRAMDHNIRFAFPQGFRLTGNTGATDVLVAFSRLDEQISAFLTESGIRPIIIDYQGG